MLGETRSLITYVNSILRVMNCLFFLHKLRDTIVFATLKGKWHKSNGVLKLKGTLVHVFKIRSFSFVFFLFFEKLIYFLGSLKPIYNMICPLCHCQSVSRC